MRIDGTERSEAGAKRHRVIVLVFSEGKPKLGILQGKDLIYAKRTKVSNLGVSEPAEIND